MLRLQPVAYERPESVEAAVARLRAHGETARVVAGGTDLLPNLKLGSAKAETLISLTTLAELAGIRALSDDDETIGGPANLSAAETTAEATAEAKLIEIGARTTLQAMVEDPLLQRTLPALVAAVARIASHQIRNRATLAGNLCLDTRCRYINQSELFREALGGCLKSHGDECHVVPGGQNCVAALSCDTAPILIALGAHVRVVGGVDGPRRVALRDFYNTDGLRHTALADGELITAVRVPTPGPGVRVAYRKWARRKSIDFPLVSVALRLETSGEAGALSGGVLAGGMLVVGALGPRPRVVRLTSLVGRTLDEALAVDVGALAVRRCRPLANLPYSPAYRRRRIGVEATRAVRELLV